MFVVFFVFLITIEARIRRLVEEKNELSDQLRRVKLDLEEERTKSVFREKPVSMPSPASPNGPASVNDVADLQSKRKLVYQLYLLLNVCNEWWNNVVCFLGDGMTKQINDYKVKLQKADQEIATLQASVRSWSYQLTKEIYFNPNFVEGGKIGNSSDTISICCRSLRKSRRWAQGW